MTLVEIVRAAMLDALKRNNGNKAAAARDLDIARRTLENWILGKNKTNKRLNQEKCSTWNPKIYGYE